MVGDIRKRRNIFSCAVDTKVAVTIQRPEVPEIDAVITRIRVLLNPTPPYLGSKLHTFSMKN